MSPTILAGLLLLGVSAAPAEQTCEPYTVTAYAAAEYPGWTADGSMTTWQAINRGLPLAAASFNVPFGSLVEVPGLGTFEVHDRGHLGVRHIDVLVPDRATALEIGRSTRTVCVMSPEAVS